MVIRASLKPRKLLEKISNFQLKRAYELGQYNMDRRRLFKGNGSEETSQTAMVTHPKQRHRGNLNIVRSEASINFRNRTKEYLNGKIKDLEQTVRKRILETYIGA
jgi:hypothetical protein